MAVAIPSSKQEVSNRMRADVQSELPTINPFLDATLTVAFINGMVGRIWDNYVQIGQVQPDLFPTTKNPLVALMWGALVGVTQLQPAPSIGSVTFVGNNGAQISQGAIMVPSQQTQYQLTQNVTISAQQLQIISLTRVGTTAFAKTASEHHLGNGISVIVSGAIQTDYNVTTNIIVDGLDSFNYPVDNNPPSPATGNPIAAFVTGTGVIQSLANGSDTNLPGGTQLTLSTPFPQVSSTVVAQFDGIQGGTDLEPIIPDYQNRYLKKYRNPNTPFNVATIESYALSVPGVTRAWVLSITPDLGQVTVYFTRDNDENNIPTPDEVNEVKQKILTILPADMADYNLFVLAPTPKTVNFTFASIFPDSLSMRNAITESLNEFFRESTMLGQNLQKVAYDSVIYNTIDPSSGSQIQSFSLLDPTDDIAIASFEIPVLGSVNFT